MLTRGCRIFTTNKKPDAFMNTSYLQSCCRVIEEKMEYPTDELIAYLIRTQQLSQSISMTLAFRNNSLPLSMMIKSFQEQIGQLRASIPESVKKHGQFPRPISTSLLTSKAPDS